MSKRKIPIHIFLENNLIVDKKIMIDDEACDVEYIAEILYNKLGVSRLERERQFTAILNKDKRLLGILLSPMGEEHSIDIDFYKMVLYCELLHGEYVVNVHNHPTAFATPTYEDFLITQSFKRIFRDKYYDDLIVCSGENGGFCHSMEEGNFVVDCE